MTYSTSPNQFPWTMHNRNVCLPPTGITCTAAAASLVPLTKNAKRSTPLAPKKWPLVPTTLAGWSSVVAVAVVVLVREMMGVREGLKGPRIWKVPKLGMV
ncbi:uncharacterized protein EV422DRAFT_543652 [Fimicolochytrium jonesii]|uniref:uncharacterized protein n=1 Tax=Fimicolochytrium jonesii TaxID=1396493 RepID=UPI0022FE8D1C|nr:uncharacterized protein EV422DRAFT_543652 [Fimicolochytrium jonesii]KAI8816940.1 hypothetical protein EV422DRAFT_543652 [Fimicolochytrium jonesii]